MNKKYVDTPCPPDFWDLNR